LRVVSDGPLHSLHCTHYYHRSSIPEPSGLANIIPAHLHTTKHPHILPPHAAHHVGAGRPELRQRPSQEQRQILRNSPRQLHQTKHSRIRWHRQHNSLERANKHHRATRVQQEVCCGRRRWMWKDVSLDQLQPGSLPRGECRMRQTLVDYLRETLTDKLRSDTFPPSSKTTSHKSSTRHLARVLNLRFGILPARRNTTDCDLFHTPRPTCSSSASQSTAQTPSRTSWTR
jgi:hypothetical protein